jgi:predicted nucleic-acid-binding protein
MNAVDTNVLIRLIVQDDPAQEERAKAFCRLGVSVSLTVSMEMEWVLRSRYKLHREAIIQSFHVLIATSDCHFENLESLKWGLMRYRQGADFADMIHLASSQGAEGFGSFDRSLARDAGDSAPVPIMLV